MVPPPIVRGRIDRSASTAGILTRCVGGSDARGYGRGRRPTAFRSMRALTESPISASSAAACAAMPRMSLPVENSARPGRGGVGGTPAGWAGWRRRSGRGADGRRVVGAPRRAAGVSRRAAGVSRRAASVLRAPRARSAAVAPARFGAAGASLPAAAPAFAVPGAEEDADRFGREGDARLSLRRCGRLRGSAPRTSEGRSSLNRSQSWRKPPLGAPGNALLPKSEQDLKPPSRLRVYV